MTVVNFVVDTSGEKAAILIDLAHWKIRERATVRSCISFNI